MSFWVLPTGPRLLLQHAHAQLRTAVKLDAVALQVVGGGGAFTPISWDSKSCSKQPHTTSPSSSKGQCPERTCVDYQVSPVCVGTVRAAGNH